MQSNQELLESLSDLKTSWKDDFANRVVELLDRIPEDQEIEKNILVDLLTTDFEAASTIIRLFLELSKDEYMVTLKTVFEEQLLVGKSGFQKNKEEYTALLDHLLIRQKIFNTINRSYSWKDIITERLKTGRGSAIKGQKRGRALEDFVEAIVSQVFSKYDIRCSFKGLKGLTTEKADFSVPSRDNPEIIIEVKGYGATGSKQTDVIGDIHRIIQEKRHDTTFLLFTDGLTWRSRESDFKKLVKFQNEGYIYRIYTKTMKDIFLEDLLLLKSEKSL